MTLSPDVVLSCEHLCVTKVGDQFIGLPAGETRFQLLLFLRRRPDVEINITVISPLPFVLSISWPASGHVLLKRKSVKPPPQDIS